MMRQSNVIFRLTSVARYLVGPASMPVRDRVGNVIKSFQPEESEGRSLREQNDRVEEERLRNTTRVLGRKE